MKFAIQLCWLGLLCVLMFQSAAASSYQQAGEALFEGETSHAKRLILTPGCTESSECNELSVLYHLLTDDSDAAIEQLSAYEKKYADVARTHAFAAEAWRSIGHQVNIFRKSRYYNKALQAKFQAGIGVSAAPRYKVLRASAFGQEGDLIAQRELTDQIVESDAKWGYIAQINLAQNTDKLTEGKKITAQALASYPNDFFINERAAQFYWTTDDLERAQRHFLIACKATPPKGWFDRKKWLDACTLVAQFADQENLNPSMGVAALQRILKEQKLLTWTNLEYVKALLKLAKENERAEALAFLHGVIQRSSDKGLVEHAKKVLEPYT